MTEVKFKEMMNEIEEEISIHVGDKKDLVISIQAIIKRYIDYIDRDPGGWDYEVAHANDWRNIHEMGSI